MRSKVFALTAVMLLMAAAGVALTPTASAAIGDVAFPGHTGDYFFEGKMQLDGTIRLTGINTGGAYRDVVIPSEAGGKRISSFTASTFQGNPYITSILIEEGGITSIYDDSFRGCTSLTSVVIEARISELGKRLFEGCTSLSSVTLPDSVTTIKYHAFGGCTALTSITIPGSVSHIGWAFEGCSSLTSITIPGSVKTMDAWAFTDCTSLTSVKFLGDAPDHSLSGDNPLARNSPLTVYYNPGASGFTTPTWFGVPCRPLYTTITFDSVGGSYVPTRQVAAGEPLGSLPTPTKAGYTFNGWYHGSTKVTSSTVPSGDMTLTAKWTANVIQYTAPPSGNLAVGTYWSHQISTTPGVVITVSGAGTSWLHVSGGTLSGIPTSAGVYEVSVTLTAPNYISQSKSFTLNVVPQLVLTNSPAAGAIAYVVG